MNIKNVPHSSIWYDETDNTIRYIDQTFLPWELKIRELRSLDDAVRAIMNMEVRGAPLIGVVAAFGYYLGHKAHGSRLKNSDAKVTRGIADRLLATRPTAVNLQWAIGEMEKGEGRMENAECRLQKAELRLQNALQIRQSEIDRSYSIGKHGLELIKQKFAQTQKPVNILTHCNAGWLACVDYGTALAPVYLAHDAGIPVHVWVDETRPRLQGAYLTAYELSQHGVPCTLIPDNTGGHLMQNDMVDMVITGTDRVAANGDVANKIGTYLKALAAKDNNVPFYVAMPMSSFDSETKTGRDIPIEERDEKEVLEIQGVGKSGCRESGKSGNQDVESQRVRIAPDGVRAANYGFDITPARMVTAYITENGVKSDTHTL